jgi:hypothetical protein
MADKFYQVLAAMAHYRLRQGAVVEIDESRRN